MTSPAQVRSPLPPRATRLQRVVAWLDARADDYVTSRELDSHFRLWGQGRGLAHELVQLGYLLRCSPGIFRVVRAGVTHPEPVRLGERLDGIFGSEGYAVAYGTAMALHGLPPALDASAPIHVLRPTNSRLPGALTPHLVDHQGRGRLDDVERVTHPALGELTVRSARRTLFDALESPKHCGDVVQVAKYLALLLKRTKVESLIGAVDAKVRRVAVCRLGYLLELIGTAEESLVPLRRRAGGGYVPLDRNGAPGPLHRAWRLRLNVPEEALRAALATGSAPAAAG